jgi:hypothetical protein
MRTQMTDTGQFGLRGPVRVCETEREYVYPDRQWVMHTSTIFSTGGGLLEQRHRNPDGSHWSMECRYDDGGRLSQKDEANIQGTQLLYYHYDSFGRLERVVARSATGTDRVYELYQYDETGRKTVTVYPDPALRGKLHTTVETAFETSADASSIVTHFDHQDRPWKRLFYDLNGRVERRILMRYDAAGRLVEDGEGEAEGIIREDLRRLYGYDAEGRLIETTMYYYGLWMYRTTFGYNDQGDIIEERHQHTGGIIEESGERDWKTQSRYQYDDRGNWTERVTENVLGTGDRRLSMIERRRIDYY